MLFKYFKDIDSGQSISVNPNNVMFVRETSTGTKIFFNDSNYILVSGDFLEVTTRLSEV
jgi:hypothetical protein